MLVESVGSALIVGKLRGGKLKHIFNTQLKKVECIVAAAVIQALASFAVARELTPYWEIINNNVILIQLFVYVLLLIGCLSNLHLKGMPLIILGIILNFIVIMANGGRMPVDISSIKLMLSAESVEMLQNTKSFTHVAANESTRFLFLADIIHIKRPYPLPKSLSVGDIFMMVGIFSIIYKGLLNVGSSRNKKIFRYNHHL